ncbi:MAG TPA: hypothetical protein VIO83_11245 [Pseudomonas sp.]
MTSAISSPSRTRWLRIATATWLLLISGISLVNSVGLSRLAEQAQGSAQEGQLKAMTARVADLEQQAEASKHQPAVLSQASFTTAQQALEERLAKLEQGQAGNARADDLPPILRRLDGIETRLQRARQTAPTPAARQRTTETVQPKAVVPPFMVLGFELRGGERFLSIAPTDTASLTQARLLRPGEAAGDWQLESFEGRSAVFRVGEQIRRIAVP